MNPHDIRPTTVDPTELAEWTTANKRAARAYRAEPIVFTDTPPAPCVDCHEDRHGRRVQGKCDRCYRRAFRSKGKAA